jgi:hypothetical protein
MPLRYSRRTPASASLATGKSNAGIEQNQLRFLSVNILLQPHLTVPEAKGQVILALIGVGADVVQVWGQCGAREAGQVWARVGASVGWRRSSVGPVWGARGWPGVGSWRGVECKASVGPSVSPSVGD